MSSTETTSSYILKTRTISNRLAGLQIDTLLPLFAIKGLDPARFDGTISHFTSGELLVVNTDLPHSNP